MKRHHSSIYIPTASSGHDPRYQLRRLLDTSAGMATPSLRKRHEVRKQQNGVGHQYLYLVLFEHKKTKERFLKIGITAYAIADRFYRDEDIFSITILAQSSTLRDNTDIRRAEREIHTSLQKSKMSPKPKLKSGGNTECYYYNETSIQKLSQLIKSY